MFRQIRKTLQNVEKNIILAALPYSNNSTAPAILRFVGAVLLFCRVHFLITWSFCGKTEKISLYMSKIYPSNSLYIGKFPPFSCYYKENSPGGGLVVGFLNSRRKNPATLWLPWYQHQPVSFYGRYSALFIGQHYELGVPRIRALKWSWKLPMHWALVPPS